MREQEAWNDQDLIWEKLAAVSKKASRSAKRFARRMGRADEYVVKHGELDHPEEASTLINEIKTVQMRKIYHTARSLSSGLAASTSARRSSFNERAGSDSAQEHDMSQSVRSHSSRRRSRSRALLKESASETHLDRAPLDFDDVDEKLMGCCNSSSRTTSTMLRYRL